MKKNQTAFLKLCLAGALIKLMEIQKSDTINKEGVVYVYKISKTEYDFAIYLVEHGAAS